MPSSLAEKGGRTVTKVFNSEAAGVADIAAVIELGSTVHADEAPHWDALHDRFLTKRINHEWAYSDEGACTNDAESFFSRVRRAEIGIHHHIAGPYFAAYVAEMAWREDNRRVSNGPASRASRNKVSWTNTPRTCTRAGAPVQA